MRVQRYALASLHFILLFNAEYMQAAGEQKFANSVPADYEYKKVGKPPSDMGISVLQTMLEVKRVDLRKKAEADDYPMPAMTEAQQQNQSVLPSFVVLLTTYNEPTRKEMYEQRLKWWLSETTLPIYVVDSYDTQFPQYLKSIRKFREYHYNQTSVLGNPPRGGSTPAEILALKKAFRVFGDEWVQYDYVVKITGKYVLPTLTAAFATMSKGRDFIVQSAKYALHSDMWVGTECMGFDAKRMGRLLAEIEVQPFLPLENKVAKLLWSKELQILPRMPVPVAYQVARGNGDVLREL